MNLIQLSEAREELWAQGNNTSDHASATAAEKSAWDKKLNRVVQRFFETMKPARTYCRIDLPIYDSTITLPRECESLLGVVPLTDDGYRTCPLFIFSRFHEFAEYGNSYSCSPVAQPLADRAQTFRDPEAGFLLRAKSTADIGAHYTLIGGTDTSDDEFFDSVDLAIDNGTTTTSREWNTLPRMVKGETDVAVELYAVDGDGVEMLIAVHAPGETAPSFQRYTVPDWGDTVTTARVLTRLCYVRLTADTDIVIPSSFGALQLGLQALQYETVNDWPNADAAWAKALALIDSGKGELEGAAEIPVVRSMPGFGCDGMASIDGIGFFGGYLR